MQKSEILITVKSPKLDEIMSELSKMTEKYNDVDSVFEVKMRYVADCNYIEFEECT